MMPLPPDGWLWLRGRGLLYALLVAGAVMALCLPLGFALR